MPSKSAASLLNSRTSVVVQRQVSYSSLTSSTTTRNGSGSSAERTEGKNGRSRQQLYSLRSESETQLKEGVLEPHTGDTF